MIPEDAFQPTYAIPVLLGLALTALFPASRAIRDAEARRKYRILQVATLVGAIVGAKLAAMFGDLGWPLEPIREPETMLLGGRSITGALLGGFLGAEALKPVLRYHEPPNDRFAMILPFSVAIGRVGCLLSGCCRGAATSVPWAVTDADGIARHPAPVYEILFQLAVGGLFVWMVRNERMRGRVFAVYLVLYGTFRFFTEMIRDTPRLFGGVVSGYQAIALLLVLVGAAWGLRRELPRGNTTEVRA
jgi:phosphatidylglycerol---prolipoprotein diacylglyceryl transferase